MCGATPIQGGGGNNGALAPLLQQLQLAVGSLSAAIGAPQSGGVASAAPGAFAAPSATAAPPGGVPLPASAARTPWMQVSGASANEVALLDRVVARAQASPSARALFADLQRSGGLHIVVRDDALDPTFSKEPNTVAYEQQGVMYMRRSELARTVKGDRLTNTFIHEATHVADRLDRSRIMPIFEQIYATYGPARYTDTVKRAETTAVLESRAYAIDYQIMIELGLEDPQATPGFGRTGKPIGEATGKIMQAPGYAVAGVTQTIAQSLPDALIGMRLLG